MERDELIQKINAVTSPTKDRNLIYEVLDALNIPYKKTNCGKCLTDLYNIAREELGIIGSAAEQSAFDGDSEPGAPYIYAHHRAVRVNGKVYNRSSSQEDLRYLHGLLGAGYVRKA